MEGRLVEPGGSPPPHLGLAFIIQKTWGRAVLNEEKKKELWKDLDVPANCKVLKTPKLNTKIYIRVSEMTSLRTGVSRPFR